MDICGQSRKVFGQIGGSIPSPCKGLYRMSGSRFYWYRWTQDGDRHAVSLKTDDLSEAIKKVQEIQAGAWFARWERADKAATPVARLVEKYVDQAIVRVRPARQRAQEDEPAATVPFDGSRIPPSSVRRHRTGDRKPDFVTGKVA
jgi:hypothetical protein